MHRGYIKFYRKFTEWEWRTDPYANMVLNHLLAMVNNKEKTWKGEVIKKGSLATSMKNFSNMLDIHPSKLRRILIKLTKSGDITVRGVGDFSIITLCKYVFYQEYSANSDKGFTQANQLDNNNIQDKEIATPTNDRQMIDEGSTNDRQMIDTQSTTTKEVKKLRTKENKNKKKETIKEKPMRFPEKSLKFNLAFEEYLDMRKKKRATATDKAIVLIFKKLHKLGSTEDEQIEILEESVLNNWTGIFALKTEEKQGFQKRDKTYMAPLKYDKDGNKIRS